MAEKPGIAQRPAEVFRRRAAWCRNLAAGLNDPEFAIVLGKLAKEYEGQAVADGMVARLKGSISKQATVDEHPMVVELTS